MIAVLRTRIVKLAAIIRIRRDLPRPTSGPVKQVIRQVIRERGCLRCLQVTLSRTRPQLRIRPIPVAAGRVAVVVVMLVEVVAEAAVEAEAINNAYWSG